MSTTTCSATTRKAERRGLPLWQRWSLWLLVVWLAAAVPTRALAMVEAEARAQDEVAERVSLPQVLSARIPGWFPRGSGTLRWFGFDVYRATLWAAPGVPIAPEAEFGLAIRYQRAISAERLVSTTLSEMRRLGVADETTADGWRATLAQVFPDVVPGDVIVGVNEAGARVAFYHGERRTGVIEDAAFARAFFAIWLDARTREPGLRAQLLGEWSAQDG